MGFSEMFGMEGELDKFEMDTIIAGLMKRLPKPGTVWPEGKRQEWLTVLVDAFKLIYQEDAPTTKA